MSTSPSKEFSIAARTLFEWSEDPIQAIRDLFGAEPTKQQTEMITAAWKPFSRVAVASCTGAGKTTAFAWLTFLLLLTHYDCRVLVTSPSFGQLNRVYQSELRKWYKKMPKDFQDAFEITRERVVFKSGLVVNEATLVTASAENKESLQGGHAEHYVILADEASGIDSDTFAVLQRTLSTGNGGRFILASNPTRSSGDFYNIFHNQNLTVWTKITFTAFDCPHINPDFPKEMAEMYGEDSDHYRISILGQFPRAANTQFIRTDYVDEAMKRKLGYNNYSNFPVIMAIDVARFGDDETVFIIRQGPIVLDIETHRGLDTQQVAALALEYARKWNVSVCFIDSIGVGAGVFDRCKHLKMPVKEVMGSNKSTKPLEYYNMRSQLWGEMRLWLSNGGCLPKDTDLRDQLVGMTYGFNSKMQIALTTKEQLKKMKVKSPDRADALALTFAGEAYTANFHRHAARRVVVSKRIFV